MKLNLDEIANIQREQTIYRAVQHLAHAWHYLREIGANDAAAAVTRALEEITKIDA